MPGLQQHQHWVTNLHYQNQPSNPSLLHAWTTIVESDHRQCQYWASSTISVSAIQSLITALRDEDKGIRSSALSALVKQVTLPESAIQSLIIALKDDNWWVRSSAALALGKQYTLTESAIKPLIALLKDEDEDVKHSASEILRDQCHSLCVSLPHLTKDEAACLYENHLFDYSCNHVISLQVQDGRLRVYTEQGLLNVGPIGNGMEKIISSAFRAVQEKAGLKT